MRIYPSVLHFNTQVLCAEEIEGLSAPVSECRSAGSLVLVMASTSVWPRPRRCVAPVEPQREGFTAPPVHLMAH